MTERLSVDELFAAFRDFFRLMVANLDHDRLVCDTRDCQQVLDDATAYDCVMLAVSGDQAGGISAFRLKLLCHACRDRMNAMETKRPIVGAAPAIDEILRDTPDLPKGL